MITKDENAESACGVSWQALALTRIKRVAQSSLVVPKPRSVVCVRARNSSVAMSAALWETGDPNALMNTQTGTVNGQAAQPPCAREAVAAELATIRERAFEARERMMSSYVDASQGCADPGKRCVADTRSYRYLIMVSVQGFKPSRPPI